MSDPDERRRAREERRANRGGDDDGDRRTSNAGDEGNNDDGNNAAQDRQDEERKVREKEAEQRRREVDEERHRQDAEKEKKKKAEAEAQEKKKTGKKGKRRGLGGLGPEKKKLLKTLIMQRAAEALRQESLKRQKAKEDHLNKMVGQLNVQGLDDRSLETLVKDLHNRKNKLEEEKLDLELKLNKQENEMNELAVKVNDVKGKFVKPVLKKITKTDIQFAKIAKKTEHSASFRGQLRSSGQNKFALEEKEDAPKTDFREQLKQKPEVNGQPEEVHAE